MILSFLSWLEELIHENNAKISFEFIAKLFKWHIFESEEFSDSHHPHVSEVSKNNLFHNLSRLNIHKVIIQII